MKTENISQSQIKNLNKESDLLSQNQIKNLPDWDLSDLYNSPSAKKIEIDLKKVDQLSSSFSKKYENKLSTLSSSGMLECVKHQEKITNLMGRLSSFASLRYYQLTTDPSRVKLLSDIQDKITEFGSRLVFFTLEFNSLDDKHLKKLLKNNSDLSRYSAVFNRMRALKPYQLRYHK